MRSDSSGKWYEVAFADGLWVCDCLGFKYRGTECKHMRKVRGGLVSDPAAEPAPKLVRIKPVVDDTYHHCGAVHAVKSGQRRNKSHIIQRYRCRRCDRWFSGNYGFEGQRADRGTVTDAINLHLDGGMSSRKIQRHLKRHGLRFSHVSVRNWINKYASFRRSTSGAFRRRWASGGTPTRSTSTAERAAAGKKEERCCS